MSWMPLLLVLLQHTDLRRSPKVVWTRSGPCLLPLMTNPSSALITAQEIVCSWPVKIARGVGTWIEISVLILIWIWTCITIEIQTLKYLALPYDCLCSSIPMPKEHLLKKNVAMFVLNWELLPCSLRSQIRCSNHLCCYTHSWATCWWHLSLLNKWNHFGNDTWQ